jgi:hypothetical protein
VLDTSLREDPRNEDFRMTTHRLTSAADLPPQSKEWKMPRSNRIDQGREGMCVGAATAHWYGSEWRIQEVTFRIAHWLYKIGQKYDEWPGENYSGTSVNGMMRALSSLGLIGPYFWIREFDELLKTLSFHGPVIMGAEWKEGCFEPDRDGYITFTGATKGGHAVEIRILDMERGRVGIQQSWGDDHGDDSVVWMTFDEFKKLLATRPQIVFPEKRVLKHASKPNPKPWWKFWA